MEARTQCSYGVCRQLAVELHNMARPAESGAVEQHWVVPHPGRVLCLKDGPGFPNSPARLQLTASIGAVYPAGLLVSRPDWGRLEGVCLRRTSSSM